jgi:hypothetical protein
MKNNPDTVHFTLPNPLKRYGVNNRRLIASWNDEYLTKVLEKL